MCSLCLTITCGQVVELQTRSEVAVLAGVPVRTDNVGFEWYTRIPVLWLDFKAGSTSVQVPSFRRSTVLGSIRTGTSWSALGHVIAVFNSPISRQRSAQRRTRSCCSQLLPSQISDSLSVSWLACNVSVQSSLLRDSESGFVLYLDLSSWSITKPLDLSPVR